MDLSSDLKPGVTPEDQGKLVLFGSARLQSILLKLAGDRNGAFEERAVGRLIRAGIVVRDPGQRFGVCLDFRHPAFADIWESLGAVGDPRFRQETFGIASSRISIDADRPLGHVNRFAFRVLYYLVTAGEPLTLSKLRVVMPDADAGEIVGGALSLSQFGVVTGTVRAGFRISPETPEPFLRVVAKIGEYLARTDARYCSKPQTSSESKSMSGLSRLFGSNIRLLHLMGLAREGPLHLSDLRRIIGIDMVHFESDAHAPFGRGSFVKYFDTPNGPAAMLDPLFPLALELRVLLLRAHQLKALPPLTNRLPAPAVPVDTEWVGDNRVFLGGEITTAILMSIAAFGWSFEAACVDATPGCHRENIKKAIHRLEEDGIIISDRSRRPGFDARIFRLDPEFAAFHELRLFLARAIEVWPEYSFRAQAAIEYLPLKTRVHLFNRGLLTKQFRLDVRAQHKKQERSRRRLVESMRGYRELERRLGYSPTARDLQRVAPSVYRRVLTDWGGMPTFRLFLLERDSGKGSVDKDSKEQCIDEYRELANQLGYSPNSNDLSKTSNQGLYRRILRAWGTFPAFVTDVQPRLSRKKRDPRNYTAAAKAECLAEYEELVKQFGYAPTSMQLPCGLQKRIRRAWGGFRPFLAETQIKTVRPLLQFESSEAKRSYCIARYIEISKQLGYAPSSYKVRAISPGLVHNISSAWPSFADFCLETGFRVPRISKHRS